MNACLHPLWTCIPRSEAAGPCVKSMLGLLRSCQPALQCGRTASRSHWQRQRLPPLPVRPSTRPCLFALPSSSSSSSFFSNSSVYEGYSTVALICISLMTNNDEHLFMYLLVICVFSLKKHLFNPLPILKMGFLFLLFTCKSSLYFGGTSP